jgi:hypothetical protein
LTSDPEGWAVKQVSYSEEEVVYVAGRDIADAQQRRGDHRAYGYVEADSPADAPSKESE